MANAVFTELEKVISQLGTVNGDSTDLSELSLVGKGEERAIVFSLLGANLIFTPEGEVVSVDGTEENSETYALVEDMKRSVQGFLNWRTSFIKKFGI